MNKLFTRVLAMMCGVAAGAMGLALLLQERSLSLDLQRAAEARLDAAAFAAGRLLENHLEATTERYRAISGTPQLRATLEVDDVPTLEHYAEDLRAQHGALRIAFLDADGGVVAGAGPADVDAVALAAGGSGVVAHDGLPYAVASTDLAGAGRLVAVEPIEAGTLVEWSELCGAGVSFAAPDEALEGGIQRVVRDLGTLRLRAVTTLEAEQAAMRHARFNLALAGGLGFGVACAMSVLLSGGLVRPILELKAAASKVGSGDLAVALRTERRDEIGDVARAFQQMTRDLRETLGRVAEAAESVDATASRISLAAGRLSSVTEEQVRGIEEAAGSLDHIGTQVQEIAGAAAGSAENLDRAVAGSSSSFKELAVSGETLRENASLLWAQTEEIGTCIDQMGSRGTQAAGDAEQLLAAVQETAQAMVQMEAGTRGVHAHAEETARLSEAVVQAAESGRQQVRETLAGMEAIQAATEEARAVIRTLRTQAEEIGTVLTVIDDVTGETNLLALNASIIASQAGESGRAFAVVAAEMKALAERVQASTQEIDGLVRAVQQGSADAVACIERGSSRVKGGVDLARQADRSLETITGSARESGARMGESVETTAEQMRAAAHIVNRVQAVSEGAVRIREVTREQERGNAVVRGGSDALRKVAQEVQETIDSQARGAARIGESIEVVQRGVEEIRQGLERQAAASLGAASAVKRSREHTLSHERSAAQLDEAAQELAREAELLRNAVLRFRI